MSKRHSYRKDKSSMKWINAFYNPYKFFRAPFQWLKCFFRSFSIARDRIVRGWSPYDVWDLDSYINQILGQGLDYLADNHMGYPGTKPFDTPEKWTEWLHTQAKAFRDLNRENDEENPFAERYWKYLDASVWETQKDENGRTYWHHSDACPIDLREKYERLDKIIYERKQTNLRLALKELGEHWGNLWD